MTVSLRPPVPDGHCFLPGHSHLIPKGNVEASPLPVR